MSNETKVPLPDHPVIHPNHYGGDTKYEVVKVVREWGLGFELGNAVKYIARAGKKDLSKFAEDLDKAIFYLQLKKEDWLERRYRDGKK